MGRLIDTLPEHPKYSKMAHLRQMLAYKDLKLQKHISKKKSVTRNQKDIASDLSLWMTSENDLDHGILRMLMKQSQSLKVEDKNLTHRATVGDYSSSVSALKTVFGVNKVPQAPIPETQTSSFDGTHTTIAETAQRELRQQRKENEDARREIQMKMEMADYLNRVIKK